MKRPTAFSCETQLSLKNRRTISTGFQPKHKDFHHHIDPDLYEKLDTAMVSPFTLGSPLTPSLPITILSNSVASKAVRSKRQACPQASDNCRAPSATAMGFDSGPKVGGDESEQLAPFSPLSLGSPLTQSLPPVLSLNGSHIEILDKKPLEIMAVDSLDLRYTTIGSSGQHQPRVPSSLQEAKPFDAARHADTAPPRSLEARRVSLV
jgi:hypothetical protein